MQEDQVWRRLTIVCSSKEIWVGSTWRLLAIICCSKIMGVGNTRCRLTDIASSMCTCDPCMKAFVYTTFQCPTSLVKYVNSTFLCANLVSRCMSLSHVAYKMFTCHVWCVKAMDDACRTDSMLTFQFVHPTNDIGSPYSMSAIRCV